MRPYELECVHGVGHSAGVHGCDGCCGILTWPARAEAWDEGWDAGASWPQPYKWDNPYREEKK